MLPLQTLLEKIWKLTSGCFYFLITSSLKIVRFFLPTISHTCGATKLPSGAVTIAMSENVSTLSTPVNIIKVALKLEAFVTNAATYYIFLSIKDNVR